MQKSIARHDIISFILEIPMRCAMTPSTQERAATASCVNILFGHSAASFLSIKLFYFSPPSLSPSLKCKELYAGCAIWSYPGRHVASSLRRDAAAYAPLACRSMILIFLISISYTWRRRCHWPRICSAIIFAAATCPLSIYYDFQAHALCPHKAHAEMPCALGATWAMLTAMMPVD